MYDPATKQWSLIDTCFTTHHVCFGHDANNTLWSSSGGPQSGVVGWLNTKMHLETHDEEKSQGWTPLIIDTNGSGRRDDYVEANPPLDPAKDRRVMAAFYEIVPNPVDDTIWGQAMGRGFSRVDQPGYLVRVNPGPDPSNTALVEIYQPPEGSFGPRGLIATANGGEALVAIVDDQVVNLRMPYLLGFFTKNVDGRIDDPKAGWKGRGRWTTSGNRTTFHNEGGVDNDPKVYKVQMRPDPLAF